MAPQHDEIVKQLDDGFSIAWDTTKRDPATTKRVKRVVAQRAAELSRILGTGDVANAGCDAPDSSRDAA